MPRSVCCVTCTRGGQAPETANDPGADHDTIHHPTAISSNIRVRQRQPRSRRHRHLGCRSSEGRDHPRPGAAARPVPRRARPDLRARNRARQRSAAGGPGDSGRRIGQYRHLRSRQPSDRHRARHTSGHPHLDRNPHSQRAPSPGRQLRHPHRRRDPPCIGRGPTGAHVVRHGRVPHQRQPELGTTVLTIAGGRDPTTRGPPTRPSPCCAFETLEGAADCRVLQLRRPWRLERAARRDQRRHSWRRIPLHRGVASDEGVVALWSNRRLGRPEPDLLPADL